MTLQLEDPHDVGKRQAQTEIYKHAYLCLYRNGYDVPPQMREITQLAAQVVNDNYISHVHITINFPPDFHSFHEMERVVKKKWLIEWYYTWEAYNEEGEFSHPHVHLVCRKTKPKSEIIREIYSTLHEYVRDPVNIDVKEYKRRDYNPSYITKNRYEDLIWRSDNHLENLYAYDGSDEIKDPSALKNSHIDSTYYTRKTRKSDLKKVKIII